MAARKNKVQLTESWKNKIKASILAGRLYQHANGEIDMSQSQIKAADILLKKLVPDLARNELTGEGGGPVQVGVSLNISGVEPKR